MKLIIVTPHNAHEESFFCIKDTTSQGFLHKLKWLEGRIKEGLTIKILKNEEDKPNISYINQ